MLIKSQVKYIQSLSQKKHRDEEEVFVAEGPKIINELLKSATVKPKAIFAVSDWIQSQINFPAEGASNLITEITKEELDRISFLSSPNQVLGVFARPVFQFYPDPTKELVLMLDMIQDPGNLGTLVRTADWFGVKSIVCSKDSADVFNPKVVQSTMGSIGRVQVVYTDLYEYLSRYESAEVFAAMLDGMALQNLDAVSKGVLLIGNESKGVSEDLIQKTTKRITIPGTGRAESLNAAVAAGIILSRLTS